MGKYKITVRQEARADLQRHYRSGNKAIIKRIEKIFEELGEHPETGTGQPERLKYSLSGWRSRRLSSEHRLIYSIDAESVEVLVISAAGHYE